jgi:hypothetical protein
MHFLPPRQSSFHIQRWTDPKLFAEVAQIEGEDDYFPAGKVPPGWLDDLSNP